MWTVALITRIILCYAHDSRTWLGIYAVRVTQTTRLTQHIDKPFTGVSYCVGRTWFRISQVHIWKVWIQPKLSPNYFPQKFRPIINFVKIVPLGTVQNLCTIISYDIMYTISFYSPSFNDLKSQYDTYVCIYHRAHVHCYIIFSVVYYKLTFYWNLMKNTLKFAR